MPKKTARKTRQTPPQPQPNKRQKRDTHHDDKDGGGGKCKPIDQLAEIDVSSAHEDEMNKLLTSMLKGIAIIPLNLILTHLNHGTGVPLKACDRKDQKHWLGKGGGPLTLPVDDITNTDLKKLVNDSMWYGGFRGNKLHPKKDQTNVLTTAEYTFVSSMERYSSFLMSQSLGSHVFYRAMLMESTAKPTFEKAKLIGVWPGKHRP